MNDQTEMSSNDRQAVSPYLTVSDAEEAISFYETVFGAKCTFRMPAEDGKRLMHASLLINGSHIMLSDEFPEYGGFVGPDKERGSPVAISLTLKSPDEVDRIYALALKHGGTESSPPEDMFWGDRFAQVIDIAGHRWMLACALGKN